MASALADLTPRSLWSHFATLAGIPRPSKQEAAVAEWVAGVAREHGFELKRDAAGNLAVSVPADPGREGAGRVVLQAHLDMVCEKNNDVEHDFENDPIRPRIDGEWVTATGTTLGADNGIGVAAALAAATDPAVQHGPLLLLFTLDEETGLNGARELDPAIVSGEMLLNLDSEEDGALFVGCAGGIDTHLVLEPAPRASADAQKRLRLKVRGLRGGHSGLDILDNRGNALRLAARTLLAALDDGADFGLVALDGGSMHNAIPREADARLVVSADGETRLRATLARMAGEFAVELAGIDEGLKLELVADDGVEGPLQSVDRDRLLRLLVALPHGVLGMSRDIPGLVETSNNVAVCSGTESGELRIVTSARSSVMPSLRAVAGAVAAAGRLAGARVESHGGYPGWKPDLDSRALAVVRDVYRELWGAEPRVTAIHAGLECGLLGEKLPGLDMVSFGPEIRGAHSPDERVSIASVGRFWEALVLTLDRLAPRAA